MSTRASTAQAHVVGTRTDVPAGQVLHLMGSRWRLENYFRYARIDLHLDAHDSYSAIAARWRPEPFGLWRLTRVRHLLDR